MFIRDPTSLSLDNILHLERQLVVQGTYAKRPFKKAPDTGCKDRASFTVSIQPMIIDVGLTARLMAHYKTAGQHLVMESMSAEWNPRKPSHDSCLDTSCGLQETH